mgnify:CR=1 FL=1
MNTTTFQTGKLYGFSELTKANIVLEEVKTSGSGPWQITLFREKGTDRYWEKGPYGRWDAIAYILLDLKNLSEWSPPNW